jgi:hypothetical protein
VIATNADVVHLWIVLPREVKMAKMAIWMHLVARCVARRARTTTTTAAPADATAVSLVSGTAVTVATETDGEIEAETRADEATAETETVEAETETGIEEVEIEMIAAAEKETTAGAETGMTTTISVCLLPQLIQGCGGLLVAQRRRGVLATDLHKATRRNKSLSRRCLRQLQTPRNVKSLQLQNGNSSPILNKSRALNGSSLR